MKAHTHGLLLGKFLPPHRGHVYLGEFARHFVDELTIVVGTIPSEPIPGELRFRWMSELFPTVQVVHLDKDLPQEPSEHPDFWNIWTRELLAHASVSSAPNPPARAPWPMISRGISRPPSFPNMPEPISSNLATPLHRRPSSTLPAASAPPKMPWLPLPTN